MSQINWSETLAVRGEGSAANSILQAEEDKIELRLWNLCHSGSNERESECVDDSHASK